MVHTTPIHRRIEHQVWHRFEKGMCSVCGWHCIDCPKGVATCKCKPSKEELEKLADIRLQEENNGLTDSWSD